MSGKEGAGPARGAEGGAGWAWLSRSAVMVPPHAPGGALGTDPDHSPIPGVSSRVLCDPCTSAHVWGPVCGWGGRALLGTGG